MKKVLFLSFVVASVLFTAHAEEAKTVEKVPANKIEAEKTAAPLVSPKKPKLAECVAPAKPATPADAAKSAAPATQVKQAEAAESAAQAKPAEAAKLAPGTCPPEAAKPAAIK